MTVQGVKKDVWKCTACKEEPDDENARAAKKVKRKRILAVKAAHADLYASRTSFLKYQKAALDPFTEVQSRDGFTRSKRGTQPQVPDIAPDCAFVKATLRPYQVAGVNWVISQYRMGVGCIIGDEMGLGKTIQTLAFLAALKNAGLPGKRGGASFCKYSGVFIVSGMQI